MSQVSEHQPRYLRCAGIEQKLCMPMPLRKSHSWGGHQDGTVTDWGSGSAGRVTQETGGGVVFSSAVI